MPTNPYKGILSDAAIKELDAITSQTYKKLTDVGAGTDLMPKTFIYAQSEKAVEVIVADLDSSDGKKDGKVGREAYLKKIDKLLDAMNAQFPESPDAQQAIAQWKANIKNTRQDVDAATLGNVLKTIFHFDDDVRFNRVDRNRNGVIDRVELEQTNQQVKPAAPQNLPFKPRSPYRTL